MLIIVVSMFMYRLVGTIFLSRVQLHFGHNCGQKDKSTKIIMFTDLYV